jgi:hypothetical protein
VYSRPDKSMVTGTTPAATANQPPATVYQPSRQVDDSCCHAGDGPPGGRSHPDAAERL